MSESSDRALLDLIRRGGPLTVADMAANLGVTATAIRNRLTRLLGAGLVERQSVSLSIKTGAVPSTVTGRVSRRKSGSARIIRTWPSCSGMK
jgi:DNA-binding Lrp family transcriptional regulator